MAFKKRIKFFDMISFISSWDNKYIKSDEYRKLKLIKPIVKIKILLKRISFLIIKQIYMHIRGN